MRLIDGLISDCGKFIAEHAAKEGWFEVSTLKEPYRIEGKKTMGYELWEEFGGKLPDVIIYPTGGGVGLIGMWKAFEELEAMGLIGRAAPAHDFRASRRLRTDRESVRTAPGQLGVLRTMPQRSHRALRVPKPLGDFLILADLYASGGDGGCCHRRRNARGVPRHGRGWKASSRRPKVVRGSSPSRDWSQDKKIRADETVVLFNTGSGYKYLEAWHTALEN